MMNKNCARCGKPVYFAERKTSLGREWHPSCLKCERCGKVLSPGQHAEHKSLPYCHNPCYKALYGPAILGYGSNISSPANFARPYRQVIYGPDLGNGFNEIFRLENSQANKGANSQKTSPRQVQNTKLHEILQKIEEFNQYHEGKVHHQMTAEEMGDGSVHVEGPLRIYWGLSQPIQLVHCDNIPPAPIAHWRHSLCVGPESPDIPEKKFSSTLSFRAPHSPSGKSKELDDMFFSPSSPDDVVRRKKQGVRKFKTVAYRGDQPTKWKRASINGHLFNYDTSVFTPVLGSCTSVNVHSSLTSGEVIETLLEKFKVQNSPDEYVLSIVSEEGERILSRTDKPLLERLKLGPNETLGKIFIREAGGSSVTHSPNSVKTTIAETAEEENLPHEVEQLLVLPEAVLRGILEKFFKDEEKEVQTLKARYERCKKRIQQRLQEIQSFESSSRA